jgi:hypothetical protein
MSHFFGFQSNERSLRLSQKPGPVTYGGMNGNTLLYAVVATATVGFSLFGYDQGLMSVATQLQAPLAQGRAKGDGGKVVNWDLPLGL